MKHTSFSSACTIELLECIMYIYPILTPAYSIGALISSSHCPYVDKRSPSCNMSSAVLGVIHKISISCSIFRGALATMCFLLKFSLLSPSQIFVQQFYWFTRFVFDFSSSCVKYIPSSLVLLRLHQVTFHDVTKFDETIRDVYRY